MKKVGLFLILVQCFAIFGNIMSGDNIFQFGSIREIGNLIGFFFPAIIGVILIVVESKKKKDSTK